MRITVENLSSVPVDFVKLSFDDSTLREARAISDGDLSAEQAYEVDWDTARRPVFEYHETGAVSIPAGGRAVLSIQCLGKVGWQVLLCL